MRHRWLSLTLTLLVMIALLGPIVLLIWQGMPGQETPDHWQHLLDTWLMEAIVNSLWLTLISGGLATLFGVSLAWITTRYQFAGHHHLRWLLVLPLALPPYVVAMSITWWADSSGSLHLWLRELGWVVHWLEIRQLPILGLLFALLFMPYVFLLVQASLKRQGIQAFEAALALGLSPIRAFFLAVLPTIKPAIIAGASLVMMETLADYGASSLFAVPTLTQAIYRSWFNLGDWALAAQLAIGLMTVVAILLWLLPTSGQGQVPHQLNHRTLQPNHRWSAWLMSAYAWSLFGITFLLPTLVLIWQSIGSDVTAWRLTTLGQWLENSLLLAITTALIASTLALWLSWQTRQHPQQTMLKATLGLLTLGYGIPGTALAVAILLTWQQLGLMAGVLALVFAYLVRFMSLSIQSTQSGLSHLSPRLLEAASLHGYPTWQQHRRITLPLLSPHLLAGMLMVAIEVLKELPATLMLRPFNFDTLAVITYRYAQDERIPEAATAALLIVLASLLGLAAVKWLERKAI